MDALVLVVEDHTDTREGYAAYLKFIGARVASAANGETAVLLARDLKPDVIVMDGTLPGMSGQEASRILKADPHTRSIPIVSVSGREPDGPCDAFLLKPCTPQQIAEAIRDVLRKKKTPSAAR